MRHRSESILVSYSTKKESSNITRSETNYCLTTTSELDSFRECHIVGTYSHSRVMTGYVVHDCTRDTGFPSSWRHRIRGQAISLTAVCERVAG